jgi:hypothetical protein
MPFIRSEVLTLMKRLKYRIIVGVIILLLIPAGAFAMGVSPYLPLNMSPEIERQIERLLILAGRPVMTRPIAVATVLEALSDARKADEALCNQVERYLERYMPNAGLTQLRAELALDSGESKQVLPNQYGEKADSSWKVSGETFLRLGDYISFNLGGSTYQGRTTPTGTMLSLGIDYAQLDIGYRPHWLSPFTDSSMLLSTEAPTMPSITLSNFRPISSLGLTYEVYLARMSKVSHITYKDRFTTGNPRLAGLHLQMQPASGYSIGISRQMQFGGGERGQDGFNDIIDALFNPSRYDNFTDSSGYDREFGNQQASMTSRMVFSGRRPFAVYFEYAGEDTSRFSNYLLGNVSFSIGIDIPSLWDRFDFTYEATEWQNAWYLHHIYQDGLTNSSIVIGNWFGDQRQFNDDAGGMSRMVRLGWQLNDGGYMQGVYRTLKNDPSRVFDYKRMQELGLSYSRPWHGQTIGSQIYAGKDVFGERYTRISASIEFAQDLWREFNGFSTDADNDDSTEFLADTGMTYSKIIADRGNIEGKYSRLTTKESNVHLGFGARRSVSEHSDLGVRIEWDRLAGHDLYSVRMFDYRYRIGRHIALSGFFGAGRYDYGTPAYGWYMGMGPQFPNILPRWDLCVDGRYFKKMVRDKVLKSDPVSNPQSPDVFDAGGITVYLSRRF